MICPLSIQYKENIYILNYLQSPLCDTSKLQPSDFIQFYKYCLKNNTTTELSTNGILQYFKTNKQTCYNYSCLFMRATFFFLLVFSLLAVAFVFFDTKKQALLRLILFFICAFFTFCTFFFESVCFILIAPLLKTCG